MLENSAFLSVRCKWGTQVCMHGVGTFIPGICDVLDGTLDTENVVGKGVHHLAAVWSVATAPLMVCLAIEELLWSW